MEERKEGKSAFLAAFLAATHIYIIHCIAQPHLGNVCSTDVLTAVLDLSYHQTTERPNAESLYSYVNNYLFTKSLSS